MIDKKKLEDMGYNYNQTMKMVEMRKQGFNNSQIAKKFDTSRHSVRFQMVAYERLSGEILPVHKRIKK